MFVIFILGYINTEEFEEDGSVGHVERIKYIVNAYNLFVGIFTGKKPPPETKALEAGCYNVA
jgi:hypothetical protein